MSLKTSSASVLKPRSPVSIDLHAAGVRAGDVADALPQSADLSKFGRRGQDRVRDRRRPWRRELRRGVWTALEGNGRRSGSAWILSCQRPGSSRASAAIFACRPGSGRPRAGRRRGPCRSALRELVRRASRTTSRRFGARRQEGLGVVGGLVRELRAELGREHGEHRDQPDGQNHPLRASTRDYRCQTSQRTSMPVTSFSVRVPLDRTGATLSKGHRRLRRGRGRGLGPCIEGNHG